MQIETIEKDVRAIVLDISGISLDADENADLYLDLGMASIHALQLLQELEERFEIHVPDEEFVSATTIAGLTSTVRDLLIRV